MVVMMPTAAGLVVIVVPALPVRVGRRLPAEGLYRPYDKQDGYDDADDDAYDSAGVERVVVASS